MNSFISNSDVVVPADAHGMDGDAAWRRFDRLTALCVVLFFFGMYLFLVAGDPYDTGRFMRWPFGISDASPRTANASRGSDPRFNAAVIGNSRGQLLDPGRLSPLTGASFVQLTIPGTQPREQLTMLHWFKRHHPTIAALVLAVDDTWCNPDPALPIGHAFPFWLYAESDLEYLKSILRENAFDRLWRRVRVALHLVRASDPAGYWNYDLNADGAFDPHRLDAPVTLGFGGEARAALPALDRLREELADVPPAVPVIFVMPPVFHLSLPAPGTPEYVRMEYCKAGFASLARERPRGRFLDFLVDGPIARDRDGFLDQFHYRQNVARIIEVAIAKGMNGD